MGGSGVELRGYPGAHHAFSQIVSRYQSLICSLAYSATGSLGQSEDLAQNLELSEDAVKQRLSRGRKLLHEQVLAFVEGALEKTSPGKNFTLGVLA